MRYFKVSKLDSDITSIFEYLNVEERGGMCHYTGWKNVFVHPIVKNSGSTIQTSGSKPDKYPKDELQIGYESLFDEIFSRSK